MFGKYMSFNTQKRNKAKNDFEKDFYILLKNAFYVKTIENVRKRCNLEFIKKGEYKKIIKQQFRLTFNGIHESFENCDINLFRENEVTMDKPIFLGFAILQLSKLHMYETYYDKLQPYFGQENLHLHYIDTDAFVLNVNTKDIIKDLKILEDIIDFSNLDGNHVLFSNKIKEIFAFFEIETPQSI